MSFTITVNLRNGNDIYDLEYSGNIEQAFDAAKRDHPTWTSMVIIAVRSNMPELKIIK